MTSPALLEAAPRLPGGIPKILHRVWFGADVPPDAVEFGDAWERLHPDWTVVLWRDWTLPALTNAAAVDASVHAAQKADIVRFDLLQRWGGVYVDTDVEPLQPLDDLLAEVPRALAREDERWVGTAFIAARPRDPFIEWMVENLRRRVAADDGSTPPNVLTGPKFVTTALQRWIDEGGDEVTVFPRELFYPYHFSERHRRGERFPNAYAVHHWTATWIAADDR